MIVTFILLLNVSYFVLAILSLASFLEGNPNLGGLYLWGLVMLILLVKKKDDK